jgi:hypothetical protein
LGGLGALALEEMPRIGKTGISKYFSSCLVTVASSGFLFFLAKGASLAY